MFAAVSPSGQLESEGFPERVEHEVSEQSFAAQFGRERNAVRRIPPVRLLELDAMPGLICPLNQLVQRNTVALVLRTSQYAPRTQQLDETMHIGVLVEQRPVKPVALIIMAVIVVVAV